MCGKCYTSFYECTCIDNDYTTTKLFWFSLLCYYLVLYQVVLCNAWSLGAMFQYSNIALPGRFQYFIYPNCTPFEIMIQNNIVRFSSRFKIIKKTTQQHRLYNSSGNVVSINTPVFWTGGLHIVICLLRSYRQVIAPAVGGTKYSSINHDRAHMRDLFSSCVGFQHSTMLT